MEELCQTYHDESCGQSTSGVGPSRSGPSSSSSRHHPSGPPPPEISKAGQCEPPHQTPLLPPPNEMVVKTKTNSWAEPKSIRLERLACIPLPEGIKYTAMKMAVIPIINLLQYSEEAMSYTNLWAGLTHGITIPETFVRIFQVVGRLIDHSYYHNMALGYVIFRHIAAANTPPLVVQIIKDNTDIAVEKSLRKLWTTHGINQFSGLNKLSTCARTAS
jgi:hypothetical protein